MPKPALRFVNGRDIKPEPRVRVVIVKGWFTIHPVERHFPRYDFALDRIDTPIKLLGWVEHLAGKTWMAPLDLRLLVAAVSRTLDGIFTTPSRENRR